MAIHAAPLTLGWTLTACPETVPDDAPAPTRTRITEPFAASVPGCVHTDLLDAEIIADPYLDANEQALRWMFPVDWRYHRWLTLPRAEPNERVDLCFEGLDTVATVWLGESELGRTANMHRSYRFDVRPWADGQRRELVVDLASATTHAELARARLGDRPNPYGTPYQFVRKMACSFGWDWGIDLRTAGIWKPVRVERWRTARLAHVHPLVTVDLGPDGALPARAPTAPGRIDVQVEIERSGLTAAAPVAVLLELALPDRVCRASATIPAARRDATLGIEVPRAPLWWPTGYGGQPLSDLSITLTDASNPPGLAPAELLDVWRRRVGFRTAKVETAEDERGTAFTIQVNGRPVFAKGVNWVPDDHLLTRITRSRLAHRLDQAVAAHVNLVRVWGGGIYESDDFYDLCDERGLLVWQDFLLACAAYPEDAELWDEIEAEAAENVVRLMPHPSLMVWNGGNENLWGYEDWGWKERLARPDGTSLTWGGRYARELLPRLLARLDPTRFYCDNSPYTPGVRPDPSDPATHPNHPGSGTHHEWEVWNRRDYRAYREAVPRFCSEFGFQGPPAWRTLQDWVHACDGGPLAQAADPKTDPVFLVHQKAEDGNGKLDRGLTGHLGVPDDFVDWHWATQLNQARAVVYAIEHYRSWWPRTAGSIVWQINDAWPVTSWAAIDWVGRPKPLWFALQRAYAPRLLSFVERGEALCAAVVNDTDEPLRGRLALTRQAFDGTTLAESNVAVDVAARSVQILPVPAEAAVPDSPRREVLIGSLAELSATHLFVEVVDAELDPAPLAVRVTENESGYRVDVSARSLAVDVHVNADRVAPDAEADRGLVTLPAGTSTSINVRTARPDPAVDLTARPVLRCANDLAIRARPRT